MDIPKPTIPPRLSPARTLLTDSARDSDISTKHERTPKNKKNASSSMMTLPIFTSRAWLLRHSKRDAPATKTEIATKKRPMPKLCLRIKTNGEIKPPLVSPKTPSKSTAPKASKKMPNRSCANFSAFSPSLAGLVFGFSCRSKNLNPSLCTRTSSRLFRLGST